MDDERRELNKEREAKLVQDRGKERGRREPRERGGKGKGRAGQNLINEPRKPGSSSSC